MKEETAPPKSWMTPLAGYMVALLLSIPSVIALVWLGVDFKDRADLPNYWERALVTVPLCLVLLAATAWLIRKTQVDGPPPPPPNPIPAWWWPFYTQSLGIIFTVEILSDFRAWRTVSGTLVTLLMLALCAGLFLMTRDGVLNWRKSSRADREVNGGKLALLIVATGLFNLRHFSGRGFWLGAAIAILCAIPLAGYMYTNRTPRLPRLGKEA